MKRVWAAMNRFFAVAVTAGLLVGAPAFAAAKRDKALEAQLMAHIEVLASDDFGGREPGTDGEAKTLRYLGKQWLDLGLVSGTNNPRHDWFDPVTLVAREPDGSRLLFSRKGRRLFPAAEASLVLTSGKRSLVENAPVLFVGKGTVIPPRSELAGRVALLLDGDSEDSERQNALLKGGAAAVLTVLDGERSLENVTARRDRSGYALAGDSTGGDLEGFITAAAFERVLTGGQNTLKGLQASAEAPGFVSRLIDLAATLEATTRETRINTHNLIGKLPGKRPDTGAVLLMAHWDHFGRCADPPAEHLICNGAVDNASGLAVLTEVARRLSKAPQTDRDIYFVATTAEEMGLLGAHAFAENPPVPLKSIVAAFNIDTVAIAPAGDPFAVVGKGMAGIDQQIAAAAKSARRKLVQDDAANAFARRQDGWALLQHDVPAVVVSTAWSDLPRMERFMETDYHRPTDVIHPGIELGGAADDTLFLVQLARWFGDARKVPVATK